MVPVKKYTCLVLIAVSCLIRGSMAYSQVGLKAGAGASDIAFPNNGQVPYLGFEVNSLIHRLPKFSFQFGISKQFQSFGRITPLTELLLAREGLNYNSAFLYDDIKYQLNITYLKLPILLKLNTRLKDDRQSGIIAGPYFAIKINSTLVSEVMGVAERQQKDNVNRCDAGIILGYSLDVGRNPGHSLIDIRGSYSLFNMMGAIYGAPLYSGPENEYARNVTIVISFEYRI